MSEDPQARPVVDPLLVELSRILSDVDIVAVPWQQPSSAGTYTELRPEEAARRAEADAVDAAVAVWEALAASRVTGEGEDIARPDSVRVEWFARGTSRGKASSAEASISALGVVGTDWLARGEARLAEQRWTTLRSDLADAQRLLARRERLYAEAQVRPVAGRLLVRVRTSPLLLGQVGEGLEAAGTTMHPWP